MNDNTTTPPTPEAPETPPKHSNTKHYAIALVIFLVLGGGIYMMTRTPKPEPKPIITLDAAKQQSDSLYNELKHQLALYKQENEELYLQIARKESELEVQYSKIQRLIDQAQRDQSSRKTIEGKLKTLASELEQLEKYVADQTLDLDELREENRRLREEKKRLDEQYALELEARKRLEEQGATLQEANNQMEQRLKAAAVLQTTNVHAKGLRLRSDGERRGVSVAKRTELVAVCFDIVRNEVTEVGPNRFYLRLVNPEGQVVQDLSRGSGTLELWEGNGVVAYTTSRIFDYDPSVKNLCIDWYAYPDTPFMAGTYRIELYNKGRLVGTYNFNTK